MNIYVGDIAYAGALESGKRIFVFSAADSSREFIDKVHIAIGDTREVTNVHVTINAWDQKLPAENKDKVYIREKHMMCDPGNMMVLTKELETEKAFEVNDELTISEEIVL